MKRLKRECENVLDDSEMGLKSKKTSEEEKIESVKLIIGAIKGQCAISHDLSCQLVNNFSCTIIENFKKIDKGFKDQNTNLM